YMKSRLLKIRAKADSPRTGIIILKEDEWLVMVKESKEEPAINKSIVSMVAERLGISEENIRFLKGVKAKRKTLEILE
ncbi:MAG TPA: DUF167 family protein, partial [Leptospiraceae bacterium]|nr:DUF167 family protein [Leptospiraceae bacterium]